MHIHKGIKKSSSMYKRKIDPHPHSSMKKEVAKKDYKNKHS